MNDNITILIVDDEPRNIRVLEGVLFPLGYTILSAVNGTECLKSAEDNTPDIILLDIMMPGMDGYEVCSLLKQNAITAKIPVIFVTALSDTKNEKRGFEIGGVDYITKPISPAIVRERVKTHLALYNQNRSLEEKVQERTEELLRTRSVTILGLATLAEYRDNETGGHIIRTQRYMGKLLEDLRENIEFRKNYDDEYRDLLFKSAPLHDIGKVGVPDKILLKPGKLTEEEFEEMKKHAQLGHDAIKTAESLLISEDENSFLRIAREITLSHHEKWDGSGYPLGINGQDIPISGRLMSIADVYDALISKRVYKPPFTHKKAVGIIIEGKGSHFDPKLVDAFINTQEEFREIGIEFADSDEERMALENDND